MIRALSWLTLALLASAPSSRAATDLFVAVADNTLYESTDGSTSNGAGQYCFAGQTAMSELRRAVIRFDVSTIPPGSRVTDVTLTLQLSRKPPGVPPADTSLHRLTADWGEGASDAGDPGGIGAPAETDDATWIHTFWPGSLWVSVGGDFVAAASSTLTVDDLGPYSWISTLGGAGGGLVDDVQAWVDGSAGSFGWLLRGDETTAVTARRFDTRENLASTPPTLAVSYQEAIFADDFESGDTTGWSTVVP